MTCLQKTRVSVQNHYGVTHHVALDDYFAQLSQGELPPPTFQQVMRMVREVFSARDEENKPVFSNKRIEEIRDAYGHGAMTIFIQIRKALSVTELAACQYLIIWLEMLWGETDVESVSEVQDRARKRVHTEIGPSQTQLRSEVYLGDDPDFYSAQHCPEGHRLEPFLGNRC